ncbi:DUF4879 domain-containing protein [Campylobacter aviculae]|uniref:DUF4879 domain-containing protein n=1 Tax=Campylobacter aviculae TaxID=2510190 RepID=A0A4U7BU64_9BACT|nr:DUF4879 domain-containing protein [Campylobacter aviculae]TKX31887.1 DUF4879 domain-containing protein [Campylobacter aviculae]
MKKMIFLLVLSCSLVFAENIEALKKGKEVIASNDLSVYVSPDSILAKPENKDLVVKILNNFYKTLEKKPIVKSPAPPVTFVTIEGIVSEKGGKEVVSFGQTITKYHHGGKPFWAVTGVLGYGGNSNVDTATFGGSKVECLYYSPVVADSGGIIVGWLEQWDLTTAPNQTGLFIYTSKSINSPFNSMSTKIQIQ